MGGILDLELTLNRFYFGRIQPNKIQLGCFRVAWWKGGKVAISFEINWRLLEIKNFDTKVNRGVESIGASSGL